MVEEIALYRKFPKLKDLPRIELIDAPTPIQKMENASNSLRGCDIWIKRDDLCNPKYGGNKPRKYEFVLADAIKQGKKNIVTIGGIGSNHVLADAIYSKDLGLTTEGYLYDQPLTQHVRQNLLCDQFFGAKLHYMVGQVRVFIIPLVRNIFDKKSYILMPGASIPLGTLGFVNAGLELAEQVKQGVIPEPDKIFVPIGSAGTAAGLLLGVELAGLKTKIMGICVSLPIATNKSRVVKLAQNTLKLLQKVDSSIPDVSENLTNRIETTYDFFGGEYGKATFEGLEAIELAKQDGITLETVYTGKTFSGLIAYCRENKNATNETLVFWNTYNSVDLSNIYETIDYHTLPKNLHKFFDGRIALDETPVNARKIQ